MTVLGGNPLFRESSPAKYLQNSAFRYILMNLFFLSRFSICRRCLYFLQFMYNNTRLHRQALPEENIIIYVRVSFLNSKGLVFRRLSISEAFDMRKKFCAVKSLRLFNNRSSLPCSRPTPERIEQAFLRSNDSAPHTPPPTPSRQ